MCNVVLNWPKQNIERIVKDEDFTGMVNTQGKNGWTYLMAAVRRGNPMIKNWLLEVPGIDDNSLLRTAPLL